MKKKAAEIKVNQSDIEAMKKDLKQIKETLSAVVNYIMKKELRNLR